MRTPSLTGLALSREAVDRDDVARGEPDLFDALLAEPGTRVLPLWNGRTLLSAAGEPLTATEGGGWGETDPTVAPILNLQPAERVGSALLRFYLGRTLVGTDEEPVGTAVLAHVLTEAGALALEPDAARWSDLRTAGASLSARDAGLFTEAVGLANWHALGAHCPVCGAPTVVERGGWARRCLSEDRELFPRTDPAVIVGVVDDADRLLLGANAAWGGNRYSLLAGFVETGESFEQTIIREVAEEAGIRVVGCDYLGSQPWPFPASVMIGFRARLDPTQRPDEAIPDGTEIIAVHWFTRAEIWERRGELGLPGSTSIARAILEDWYGGPLDRMPPPRVDRWGGRATTLEP